MTSLDCSGDMCSYIHYSDSLTSSSSVTVDVVGCVTQRISLKNTSPGELFFCFWTIIRQNLFSVCSPEDLLLPGVDWTPMPEFTADGMGVYSFPGGNVTYSGVSLGSTATYSTSEGYLVNGVRILERRCKDTMWSDLELIISDESELKCYHTSMYGVN